MSSGGGTPVVQAQVTAAAAAPASARSPPEAVRSAGAVRGGSGQWAGAGERPASAVFLALGGQQHRTRLLPGQHRSAPGAGRHLHVARRPAAADADADADRAAVPVADACDTTVLPAPSQPGYCCHTLSANASGDTAPRRSARLRAAAGPTGTRLPSRRADAPGAEVEQFVEEEPVVAPVILRTTLTCNYTQQTQINNRDRDG